MRGECVVIGPAAGASSSHRGEALSELRDAILAIETETARFAAQPDGTLALEATLAERKTLLSRQKLVYRARVRVDDEQREVRFWELLKETSAGLIGGLDLKVEVTGVRGKERTGAIEEQSRYFGKRYDYRFDYAAVRKRVEEAARAEGYRFELVLLERSL